MDAMRATQAGPSAVSPAWEAAVAALRAHWPAYLAEGAGLGLFMISASVWATLLQHPDSPVSQAIADPTLRRVPMGLAMGLSAIAIIYSPLGHRSGAHLNPALSLTYLRLGKLAPWDHAWYTVAQFVGGLLGISFAALVLGERLGHPSVAYVATRPGVYGPAVAFLAEVAITALLMTVALNVSNSPRWMRYTGLACGALVAAYITFEAPLSGMSMNPARSFASAALDGQWAPLWIYFAAPLVGMLLAAEVYVRRHGPRAVRCAKLDHPPDPDCIFRCGYRDQAPARPTA